MAALTRARLSYSSAEGEADMNFRSVEAMVNPEEITFSKGVSLAEVAIPGLDAPVIQFVRGQAETLRVELFFDTTETGSAVTELTDQVYGLAKIDPRSHAPPICEFQWGEAFPGSQLGNEQRGGLPGQARQKREAFPCVVESIEQRFTLFKEDGTPLRAILTLSLKEYRTVEKQLEELGLQSNDHTRQHVVQQGETLPGIAARVFGNAGLWRALADHNAITDPLALEAGVILEVPPIQ